jgi:hypothetical protein
MDFDPMTEKVAYHRLECTGCTHRPWGATNEAIYAIEHAVMTHHAVVLIPMGSTPGEVIEGLRVAI